MEKQTEYEIEKQKNKQKLVRNEFLYYNQSRGKYDIPVIKKQKIDIVGAELIGKARDYWLFQL